MEFAVQSHRVTSQNLANINTPGYQAREIQFDQLLNRLDGNGPPTNKYQAVSYTHLRAHETRHDLVCRLLLEKKKK